MSEGADQLLQDWAERNTDSGLEVMNGLQPHSTLHFLFFALSFASSHVNPERFFRHISPGFKACTSSSTI